MLDVYDRCRELLEHGVPAAAIEGVDFSEVVRARDATPPDAVEEVEASGGPLLELAESEAQS